MCPEAQHCHKGSSEHTGHYPGRGEDQLQPAHTENFKIIPAEKEGWPGCSQDKWGGSVSRREKELGKLMMWDTGCGILKEEPTQKQAGIGRDTFLRLVLFWVHNQVSRKGESSGLEVVKCFLEYWVHFWVPYLEGHKGLGEHYISKFNLP